MLDTPQYEDRGREAKRCRRGSFGCSTPVLCRERSRELAGAPCSGHRCLVLFRHPYYYPSEPSSPGGFPLLVPCLSVERWTLSVERSTWLRLRAAPWYPRHPWFNLRIRISQPRIAWRGLCPQPNRDRRSEVGRSSGRRPDVARKRLGPRRPAFAVEPAATGRPAGLARSRGPADLAEAASFETRRLAGASAPGYARAPEGGVFPARHGRAARAPVGCRRLHYEQVPARAAWTLARPHTSRRENLPGKEDSDG
jgi:hypothetical protein